MQQVCAKELGLYYNTQIMKEENFNLEDDYYVGVNFLGEGALRLMPFPIHWQ